MLLFPCGSDFVRKLTCSDIVILLSEEKCSYAFEKDVKSVNEVLQGT